MPYNASYFFCGLMKVRDLKSGERRNNLASKKAYVRLSWKSGKQIGEAVVKFEEENVASVTICGFQAALALKGQKVQVGFVGGYGKEDFGCSGTTRSLAAPGKKVVTLTARLFLPKEAPKRRPHRDDKLNCVRNGAH